MNDIIVFTAIEKKILKRVSCDATHRWVDLGVVELRCDPPVGRTSIFYMV